MITAQFVQSDDIASKAIEIFERGWPSHVDIVWPDGRLLGARSDTITVGGETIPPGVQFRPQNYEIWTRAERIDIDANDLVLTKFYNFLEAQVGKPYDKTAIAAFPFQRDWRELDSWFCSELFVAALEASTFFPQSLSNAANEITPRDALLLVSPWRNNQ